MYRSSSQYPPMQIHPSSRQPWVLKLQSNVEYSDLLLLGTCKYAPEQNAIIWTIKQFPGGKEFLMRAHFGLPSIQNEEVKDARPPISVKFEIPYYTVSGIQVRYLKIIEKSGYQALPWVRYVCLSGDYQFRTA